MIGSEDKKIYIYDTSSGELVRELENPHFNQTVVHLVQPLNSTDITLVSASIDNVRITNLYLNKKKKKINRILDTGIVLESS